MRRSTASSLALAAALSALPAHALGAGGSAAGRAALRSALGPQAIVAAEPGSGAARLVMRRNGFLTRPSAERPRDIALDYVSSHPRVFGLDADDLAALRVTREQRSGLGLRRVQLAQTANGIAALDSGIRATVDDEGRLVSVSGSPLPDLAAGAPSEPRLSAVDALTAAGAPGRAEPLAPPEGAQRRTSFAGGHTAHLTYVADSGHARLAWRLLVHAGSSEVYDVLVDARDGRLLRRRNLVRSATGLAWDHYPGAPSGGGAVLRDFTPWLASTTQLRGPNAWVYSDVNDSIAATPPDTNAVQIRPSGGNWNFTQTSFDHTTGDGQSCPRATGFGACSWDFGQANSWQTNRGQNGTQVFYFVNRFHDHLATAPGIGFGPALGSFDGSDALHVQILDGASVNGGRPDLDHLNNAFMVPEPDGTAPQMSLFLFAEPGSAPEPGVNTAINDVNGGDDAAIVYHEYTHGMTNRLVCCDSGGVGLIGLTGQSGALDEAWADWYAIDFLNAEGFVPDSAAPGEIGFGRYEHVLDFRSQPMDCPPGGGGIACGGSSFAGSGGYTFGDYGRIGGEPEVHADSEIWSSTLWDLRASMVAAHGTPEGLRRARALVTGAMLVSPPFPDFLDMRDSILATGTALGLGQGDCRRVWAAFAARGMGADASTTGDADTRPVQGFANPAATACPPDPPPPPPPPASPPAPSAVAPAAATLHGAKARIRVSRRGRFSYAFRAQPGLGGEALFRTRRKVRLPRRVHLTVARKSFSVPDTGRVILRVRLSRRHLGILRRNRRLLLRVTVTVRDASGLSAVAGRNLTLLAPRR
jgi:extracellular elastinolytic metalloproteinase